MLMGLVARDPAPVGGGACQAYDWIRGDLDGVRSRLNAERDERGTAGRVFQHAIDPGVLHPMQEGVSVAHAAALRCSA